MSSMNEQKAVLANESDCTGCLACVDACRINALSSFWGEDGHLHVKVDGSRCIGCKACERVCNSSRNNYGNNNLSESSIFAGWSSNSTHRENATSGGVFAAIAEAVIAKGGVVVGAQLSGRECKHVLISCADDINTLQGSKYMVSSTSGIYKAIEKELPNRLVLFTGVGCQCAGVLAYFENSPYIDNLITIDLVCGGAPSKVLLDKFYEENPTVDSIVSFRSKDKYELKVNISGDLKIWKEKSLPLHGFNCDLTSRMNCYKCQFACAHRKTDITIGDLWNYEYKSQEHAKGLSSLITHTEKGKKILDEADVTISEIKWSECIRYCKRVVWGKSHIFRPRKKLISNAKTMKYPDFLKLYCIAMRPSDIKMEAFRIYRYLVMRCNNQRAKHYINGILKKIEKK